MKATTKKNKTPLPILFSFHNQIKDSCHDKATAQFSICDPFTVSETCPEVSGKILICNDAFDGKQTPEKLTQTMAVGQYTSSENKYSSNMKQMKRPPKCLRLC